MATSSSSSTKKAARLANKGQGKKIRFQGGMLFPLIVSLVIVLGLSLVYYARTSRPPADASAPLIDDHWHHSYGFYLCDTWFELSGDAGQSDASGLLNVEYARTGVHSHDDGVIHWHPFSSAAVGRNAKLGVFLDVYGVELTNNKLVFPPDQRAGLPYEQETGVFEDGETKCVIDGEERNAELKVIVWGNNTDTDSGTTFIADFNNIPLDNDAKTIAIAFVPSDTTIQKPPSSPDLPELGAIDSNQLTPEQPVDDSGSVPGTSTSQDGNQLTPEQPVDDSDG